MKLVFFDFNLNFGGAPQGTIALAGGLAQRHEVHIIDAYGACDRYVVAAREVGTPVHVLCPHARRQFFGHANHWMCRAAAVLRQLPSLLRLQYRLADCICRIGPDVIWVNNAKSLTLLALAARLARYPLAVYVRGWATRDQVGHWFGWLLRHRVRGVIGHARATLTELAARGIPRHKLYYVPNGLNIKETLARSQRAPERPLPNRDDEIILLLPAARLVPEKGQDCAVRALARLRQGGIRASLWLPGEIAKGGNTQYPEALSRLATTLGVMENVKFLGWWENLAPVIAACDVVVLPSHTEGFPRVILEAMLLRKPVCATPVGGIAELVEDSVTGLLFQKDDDRAMAECVVALQTHVDMRQRVVSDAYDRVCRDYDLSCTVLGVEEVFQRIGSSPGKPRIIGAGA